MMRRRGRTMGVRGRFLLVVLLGFVAPIALVGIWIARSAQSSGESLLRARLDESLGRAMQGIGYTWVDRRSALLRLAEDPAVIVAIRRGRDVTEDGARGETLRASWAALREVADVVTFRDAAGAVRGSLEHDTPGLNFSEAAGSPSLPIRLPVYDEQTNARVGSVDVRVRLSSLLPAGTLGGAIGGSVFALFDATAGTPLVPTSIAPDQFSLDRFQWAGEEWIVEHRTLDEPPLRLAIAAPTNLFTQPFTQAARRGSVALLIVLAAGFILAFLLTQRITGPLERMAEASGAIARGELEGRVAEQGPDEIRRLGEAFNVMTVSLGRTLRQLSQREAVAAVGDFASSLAHEVRNPLTSIRLDLERAREKLADREHAEELMDRALHQVDRLDAAVGGSLRIARSGTLTMTTVGVWQPLESAMHSSTAAFGSRDAALDGCPIPNEPLLVRGNAGALEQLFLNLLLNAAEAVERGGHASVAVDASPESIHITISDDGRGIPADALERILEPFYTTKDDGTGLGLPIAQRIAHAHGGELTIESRPGTGTDVHVRLPREAGGVRSA